MRRSAKVAARPDFMYESAQLIWVTSSGKSLDLSLMYSSHWLRKCLPVFLSPLYSSGGLGLSLVSFLATSSGWLVGRVGSSVFGGGAGGCRFCINFVKASSSLAFESVC